MLPPPPLHSHTHPGMELFVFFQGPRSKLVSQHLVPTGEGEPDLCSCDSISLSKRGLWAEAVCTSNTMASAVRELAASLVVASPNSAGNCRISPGGKFCRTTEGSTRVTDAWLKRAKVDMSPAITEWCFGGPAEVGGVAASVKRAANAEGPGPGPGVALPPPTAAASPVGSALPASTSDTHQISSKENA